MLVAHSLDMRRKNVQNLLCAVLLFFYTQSTVACCNENKDKKDFFSNEYFSWAQNFYDDVLCDYSIAYGRDNLISYGFLLFGTGVLANTGLDKSFHNNYQKHIRSNTTNAFFKPQKDIGLYNYLKVYVGSVVVGHFLEKYTGESLVYDWGYRTLRAMLIVSPQITLLRSALGGGGPRGRVDDDDSLSDSCRKRETYDDSKWRLFHQGRSTCSGHTFNGALPFLSAAMMTDVPTYRYTLIALSTLPGLARINDGKHYLSQIILGWVLAYLAVQTVDESDSCRGNYIKYGAQRVKDGLMLSAGYKF
jgi:hypothetical protein